MTLTRERGGLRLVCQGPAGVLSPLVFLLGNGCKNFNGTTALLSGGGISSVLLPAYSRLQNAGKRNLSEKRLRKLYRLLSGLPKGKELSPKALSELLAAGAVAPSALICPRSPSLHPYILETNGAGTEATRPLLREPVSAGQTDILILFADGHIESVVKENIPAVFGRIIKPETVDK